eukprot:gene25485-33258_t
MAKHETNDFFAMDVSTTTGGNTQFQQDASWASNLASSMAGRACWDPNPIEEDGRRRPTGRTGQGILPHPYPYPGVSPKGSNRQGSSRRMVRSRRPHTAILKRETTDTMMDNRCAVGVVQRAQRRAVFKGTVRYQQQGGGQPGPDWL